MEVLKDLWAVAVTLEDATVSNLGCKFLVIAVFLVHRVDTLFVWISRHITVKLGSFISWQVPPQTNGRPKLLEDLIAVIGIFLSCMIVLEIIEGVSAK